MRQAICIRALAIAALCAGASATTAGETVTYKGTGTYEVMRSLLPLANGGAALHLMNNTVATIEPSESGFMDGDCAGLGYLSPEGEATVKELAGPFDMSLPAVSKHLKVLERAGLLVRQVEGRTHRIRLQPEGLRTASEWVDHYRRVWEAQLGRLSAFLDVANSRSETAEKEAEETDE